MTTETETPAAGESPLEHLLQFDHWTFLLAFVTVLVNIVAGSRRLSIAAAALLASSIAYDLWEFYSEESATNE